jgi:hypothetical protein
MKRLPNCMEMARLASDALERRLSWPEHMGRFAHYLVCRFCRRYASQLRLLRRTARQQHDRLEKLHQFELSPEAERRIVDVLRRLPASE